MSKAGSSVSRRTEARRLVVTQISGPCSTGTVSASSAGDGSAIVDIDGFDTRLDFGGAHHAGSPQRARCGHGERRVRGCRHEKSAFVAFLGCAAASGRVDVFSNHAFM